MKLSIDKLILVGLVILSLTEGSTHCSQVYPDPPGYMAVAQFFQGRVIATVAGFILLRSLVPFLASLTNYLVDTRTSFAIVNLVFW